MAIRSFYEGRELEFGVLNGAIAKPTTERVILCADAAFAEDTTLINVLKKELLNSAGYSRRLLDAFVTGRNTLTKSVEITTQNLEFSVSTPTSFNTVVSIWDAHPQANAQIGAIAAGSPSVFSLAGNANHLLEGADRVFFTITGGTQPSGLLLDSYYYVLPGASLTATQFTLATTLGGSPITLGATSWTGILRMHYANGTLNLFQLREDDGQGNTSKTINPGQPHTVPYKVSRYVL